ncbi:MAG: hypothetical protein AAF484_03045 [Pseudomonadota bacterium]
MSSRHARLFELLRQETLAQSHAALTVDMTGNEDSLAAFCATAQGSLTARSGGSGQARDP